MPLYEMIANYACQTGEGPLWHPDEGRVYWVDIPAGRLFRYDPASGHHEQCLEGEAIGGFTIQADGSLLLFMARGAVRVWRDGIVATIIKEIPEERDSRFNDVIADPLGRVFCGTMSSPKHKGRLYRLDTDGSLTCVAEGIGTSNGMGFTPDLTKMYHTDSSIRQIFVYDYDASIGEISNRRLFAKVAGEGGIPDGMTVDARGHVWSARWGGYRIARYEPNGTLVEEIAMPVKKVSCVTFGGPDNTDMYVTTAGGEDIAENGEHAGALYRLRLGVQGAPEYRSRIGLS